jgi:hypothetical protein
MILTHGSTTVSIPHAHDYPYKRVYRVVQASVISGAGIRHVETYNVKTNRYVFVCNLMQTSDYELLLNFFADNAVAMHNKFSLTDDIGRTMTVRFASSDLDFALDANGLWSGKFEVEEEL